MESETEELTNENNKIILFVDIFIRLYFRMSFIDNRKLRSILLALRVTRVAEGIMERDLPTNPIDIIYNIRL